MRILQLFVLLWTSSNLLAQSPVPTNDQCAFAVPITCNYEVVGTTLGATESDSCNPGGPDVWYSLTVDDTSLVTLSMCDQHNFDALLVLKSADCSDSTCIAWNDNFCGDGPRIRSVLEAGTYSVMVRGSDGITAGDFQLDVRCDTADACSPHSCSEADRCTAQGDNCECNTRGSLPDCSPCEGYACESGGDCVPDGETCSCQNGASPPDCDLCSAYACAQRGFCGSQNNVCACLNGGTLPTCDPCVDRRCATTAGRCTANWDHCVCTNGGSMDDDCQYHDPCEGKGCLAGGRCGAFWSRCLCTNGEALEYDCLPPVRSANDDCSAAQPMVCNSQAEGNTAGATQSRNSFAQGPDVWYSLTIKEVTIVTTSICVVRSFDAYLVIVGGGCNGDRLAYNDDSCGAGPSITRTLDPGTYYVMVRGYSRREFGRFRLDVNCSAAAVHPCFGKACWRADALSCSAEKDVCACDNGAALPDCNPCAGKPCYANPGRTCNVVSNECRCANGGVLDNCAPPQPPRNDQCVNAIPISCGGAVEGDILLATASDSCMASGPDVWYSLTVPNRTQITLSMCDIRDFDAYLVLTSGECGKLKCTDWNDDYCGTMPTITTTVNQGTYRIMVRGYNGYTGRFRLRAECHSVVGPRSGRRELDMTPNDVSGALAGQVPEAGPWYVWAMVAVVTTLTGLLAVIGGLWHQRARGTVGTEATLSAWDAEQPAALPFPVCIMECQAEGAAVAGPCGSIPAINPAL